MIKAVVFDLDDTLFPERDYVLSGFKAAAAAAKSEFGISDAEKEFVELFETSRERVFDRFAAAHGLESKAAEALTAVYRDHEPDISLTEDVRATLIGLREKGVKLGIITDGRPDGQKKKIAALGLKELVDKIIITDELGGMQYRKPNPKAFELMCDELGIAFDQMLYVGDNPQKDFAVKKYLPITTVYITDNGLYSDAEFLYGIKSDMQFDRLSELTEMTDKIKDMDNTSKRQVRVLQVLAGLNYGGVSSAIMSFYRKIDRNKFHFDFTTTSAGGRWESEIKELGGNIYLLPSRSKHPFEYYKALKRVIKEGDYDIVHSNSNSAACYLDLRAAKKAGCKIRIAHSHNTGCNVKWQHYFFKPLLSGVTTHRLACSAPAAKWLFGDKSDCTILNNGIDFDRFMFDSQTRAKVRADNGWTDSYVIGHIGSLCDRKNQKFIIALLPELKKTVPNVKLVLIGGGAAQAQLREQAENSGVAQNVVFMGTRSDANELLQGMDIFCFPSIYEGLAIASVEAAVSGMSVLVSDSIPFVNVGGNVYPLPLEQKVWIDAIAENFNNKRNRSVFDEKQRMESEYDINYIVKDLEQFYLSAMKGKES